MKQKMELHYSIPNLDKMQAFMVNPPADWQQMIHARLRQLVLENLRAQYLALKAQLADYAVCETGWQYANKESEAIVASIVSDFFDTHFAPTAQELNEITL